MAEPDKKKAGYDDLYAVPENMTGEIIGGELTVTPPGFVTGMIRSRKANS
jgi:hypothetical protein